MFQPMLQAVSQLREYRQRHPAGSSYPPGYPGDTTLLPLGSWPARRSGQSAGAGSLAQRALPRAEGPTDHTYRLSAVAERRTFANT